MFGRYFNLVVGLFWLTSMAWLVTAKVLPPLLLGEPPSYRAILRDARADAAAGPVRWQVTWNDQEIGWAESQIVYQEEELNEIRNRMHFDRLPLAQMVPLGMGHIVRMFNEGQDSLSIDAESVVSVDPLGRLEGFQSQLGLGFLTEAIRVQGHVEDRHLALTVRSGDFVYHTRSTLPPNALVGDVLAPQARLTRLKVGQTWAAPVYSPFRMPNAPMQLLEARVESRELLVWNGQTVPTWLVVYRSDEGSGLRHSKTPLGRMWVNARGQVLKQEVQFLGSWLRFWRLPQGALPLSPASPPQRGTTG